jgi:signal transduction histidine kinase/GGDEF domain-containing protein
MNVDNLQSQQALSRLGKPGEAAVRFGELLSQDGWAVLGIGLNDVQPLVNHYGENWRDQVTELVAECLLAVHESKGTADDLLTRLSTGTFLVVTQASKATDWEDELRAQFREGILLTLPADHLCNGMVCPSSARRMPMPTLAVGTVRAQDGPFSSPRDLLDAVVKARMENERSALVFKLNSLTVRKNQLWEKIQVAEHICSLLPLMERFAQITTGPIHDLRNGLNILMEQVRRKTDQISDATQAEALAMAVRYSSFLLETCSEIRFRGVGKPQKVNVSRLLVDNQPLWDQKIGSSIAVNASAEPVEIYANALQITQALTDLLTWLIDRIPSIDEITIVCRNDAQWGRIDVSGDFDPGVGEEDLARQALSEFQSQRPSLYVAQKLVRRYDGDIRLRAGQVTLTFPTYRWQDIRSAEALTEQIRALETQIGQLENRLEALSPERVPGDVALKDAMRLGMRIIADMAHEFALARREAERERLDADESQEAVWASMEAGSHFCQLLTANLLALEREDPLTFYPTDAMEVLESVRCILRSKIEGLAEVDWNVPPGLPPVKATHTSLAQVVLNLTLNALEELARLRPSVSRLGISARVVEDSLQIDISDTGEGLPSDIQAWLEEKDGGAYEVGTGGVGLQVVRSILDELDGQVMLPNLPDWATTVRISVPIWEGDV